jgi:methylated-DNA-[protein]-cysteine S-methyltransferase
MRYASYRVPGGEITVVTDSSRIGDLGETSYGAVVSATYRGLDDAVDRLPDASAVPCAAALQEIASVVDRYLDGDLAALADVSVWQPGGPFQQQAWAAMRTIPPGGVDTYAGLATRAGRPRAYRAAGTACSSNMVALFIPCHRVVASHGIGGYGYGLDVKLALLEHEDADLRR